MTLGQHQWLQLPIETRQSLAKIFHLQPSGHTHVVDNIVQSDGYTYADLEPMNIEELKAITHLESDSFEEQFELMVKMVQGEGQQLKASTEAETLQINGQSISAEHSDSGTETEEQGTNNSGSGSEEKEIISEVEAVSVPGGSKPKHRGRPKSVSGSNDINQTSMAEQTTEINIEKPGIDSNVGSTESGI